MTKADKDPLWGKVKKTVAPLKEKSSRADPRYQAKPHMIRLPPQTAQNLKASRELLELNHDKKVRRGRLDIDAIIDLHDMTQEQAYPTLEQAVIRAYNRNFHCLLVVTGKGVQLNGVLRRAFPAWINSPDIRPMVANYAQAHIRHGGSGAWYVFLKRRAHN